MILIPLRLEVFLFMVSLIDLIYGRILEENFTISSTDPRIRYWPPNKWYSSTANSGEMPVDGFLPKSWRETYIQQTRHFSSSRTSWCAGPSSHQYGALEDNTMSTLHVNFTGSAIYVYGLQVPCPSSCDSPFSSYIIDKRIQASLPQPVNPSDESERVPLWYNTSLDETEHELAIHISPGYAYIFECLVYTRSLSVPDMGANLDNAEMIKRTPTTDSGSSDPEGTSDIPAPGSSGSKSRNVSTFAAAVGCTVGALFLISLTLVICIRKQRRRSRERDQLDAQARAAESRAVNESGVEAHARPDSQYSVTIEGDRPRSRSSGIIPRIYAQVNNNSSHTYVNDNIDGLAPEDSPISRTMIGPAPFIPRFFPDQTEVANVMAPPPRSISIPSTSPSAAEPDSDPPPYSPSHEHSLEDVPRTIISHHPECSILAPNNDLDVNYADIPPPIPPGLPLAPSLLPPSTTD